MLRVCRGLSRRDPYTTLLFLCDTAIIYLPIAIGDFLNVFLLGGVDVR